MQTLQLYCGTINWLTKGLFLGYRKAWIDTQIDDLFIDSDMWDTAAMNDTTGQTLASVTLKAHTPRSVPIDDWGGGIFDWQNGEHRGQR